MAGRIAACAIDLPGHGERRIEGWDSPSRTLDVLQQADSEIDGVVEALAAPEFGGAFDLDRMGIGGMSAGGMAALRRLCEPHEFKCAAVECTTGWLKGLYFPEASEPGIHGEHACRAGVRVRRCAPSRNDVSVSGPARPAGSPIAGAARATASPHTPRSPSPARRCRSLRSCRQRRRARIPPDRARRRHPSPPD